MIRLQKSSDYVNVATLFKDEDKEISVAYKGKNSPENLYLLNEFTYGKKNMEIFKKLFFLFSSNEKPAEFSDFFVFKDSFFAVFKYIQTENISKKYNKKLNTATFFERCEILEDILMKIERIYRINPSILACVTLPENIFVDQRNDIHLIFNLSKINNFEKADKKEIFKNLRDIIFTLLQTESEYKYNKALHIVLDKCLRNVYSSIPEMMVELKKAEISCGNVNFISYMKYQISLRQKLIKKVSKKLVTYGIIIGACYWVYATLTTNTKSEKAAPVVSIGDISYNGNTEDESAKDVTTEKANETAKTSPSDIVLSPGLDMLFEDYIVQYGDTIAKICDSYYKDLKYVSAVATFNGLQANDRLEAGTILKLPNRTAIALYIAQ